MDFGGLYFADEGTGPPLLLLHGLASSHRIWDPVVPYLQHRFRVIRPDLPGHGLSAPSDEYSFDALSGRIQALLTMLHIDEVNVVGHSWGAQVAVHLAATSSRVHHLTLVDGGFLNFHTIPHMTWLKLRKAMDPPVIHTSRQQFLDMMRSLYGEHWRAEWEPIALSLVRNAGSYFTLRLPYDAHVEILHHLWHNAVREQYPHIQAQALFVLADNAGPGDLDWRLLRREAVSEALSLLPHASALTLLHSIHDIPLQYPVELAGLIADFMKA